MERIFKELTLYVREKILDKYGHDPEPVDYTKGHAEIHGLHPRNTNKWVFKLMVVHNMSTKIDKFNYTVNYEIPMLYGYSKDNLEYRVDCLEAACEYLNTRFGTHLYVRTI